MTPYPEFRKLLLSGAVATFDDFFLFLEQKKFMADTGIALTRLRTIRARPTEITVAELVSISMVLDVEPTVLFKVFRGPIKNPDRG